MFSFASLENIGFSLNSISWTQYIQTYLVFHDHAYINNSIQGYNINYMHKFPNFDSSLHSHNKHSVPMQVGSWGQNTIDMILYIGFFYFKQSLIYSLLGSSYLILVSEYKQYHDLGSFVYFFFLKSQTVEINFQLGGSFASHGTCESIWRYFVLSCWPGWRSVLLAFCGQRGCY